MTSVYVYMHEIVTLSLNLELLFMHSYRAPELDMMATVGVVQHWHTVVNIVTCIVHLLFWSEMNSYAITRNSSFVYLYRRL